MLLVIVRDPDGQQPDDFFFTTDLSLGAQAVAERFANRSPIEGTFRESKQVLGLEDPQSWTHAAPERALALGFGLYSLVFTWFLTTSVLRSRRLIIPGTQTGPASRSLTLLPPSGGLCGLAEFPPERCQDALPQIFPTNGSNS